MRSYYRRAIAWPVLLCSFSFLVRSLKAGCVIERRHLNQVFFVFSLYDSVRENPDQVLIVAN